MPTLHRAPLIIHKLLIFYNDSALYLLLVFKSVTVSEQKPPEQSHLNLQLILKHYTHNSRLLLYS